MGKTPKPKLAWAGFSEGKLYAPPEFGVYDEPRYSIFPSKKAAKRAYEDVRRVKITVVSPRKRKKP